MSLGVTPGWGLPPVKSFQRMVIVVGVNVTGTTFVASAQSDCAYWLVAVAAGMHRPGAAGSGVVPATGWATSQDAAITFFNVPMPMVTIPPCATVPEMVKETPRYAEASTWVQLSK